MQLVFLITHLSAICVEQLQNVYACVCILFVRIWWHGNPLLFATYKDESLNTKLRAVAEHSHEMNFTYRVNRSIQLLGHFGFEQFHGYVQQ